MKKTLRVTITGFLLICISFYPILLADYIDDDVPIWELGDKWIYNIDDINYIGESGDKIITANLEFNDLTLEIKDASSNLYLLSFNVKIKSDFEIRSNDYSTDINGHTSRLIPTKIMGTISIKKSDLSIEEIDMDLISLLRVKIIEHPHIPIPIPALFVPLKINLNLNFQNPLPIINFPLSVEKNWTLPSIIFSIDGQIRSIWLNIINFIVRIMHNFGMDIISPEIADLLPRIDIGNLMTALKGDNIVNIDSSLWQDTPLIGIDTYKNITVPAGTFNAYDIILPIGLGNLYYSPEIGNIAKMSIVLSDTNINMELKETNYS